MIETKIGMCGLCGNKCIIEARVEDNRILSVQNLTGHPYLGDKMCVKGAALKQFVHHPDRLTTPLKKVMTSGDRYEYVPISWDEAISAIAARLKQTKEESGARATVFYAGHPKWYRKALAELSAGYGTPNFVTESSTCRSAMAMACDLVCGGAFFRPDMKNCSTCLIWTENMSGQKGHTSYVRGLKKRGAKVIAVDPRKTGITELADLHLQLYPGTDGALALGIAGVIIAEGLEDREFIEKYTLGYEEYKDYVKDFTPERTSEITGVPADKIIEAAHILAEGKVALKTSSCAVVHCVNGVQNFRAVVLLLALTGSLGTHGGFLPAQDGGASLDTFHHFLAQRPDIDDDISGGEFPVWNEVINNEGQCIRIADVILNEQPYKIRNLIAFGFNVNMWPRADRVKEALKAVEFRVVTELFWNEACEGADYVLPACTSPEMDQVVIGRGNRLILLKHMIDPGDRLNDVEIILRLAHALEVHGNFVDQPDYDAYMNYTMRNTGVTLDELKEHPEGVDARVLKEVKPFDPARDFKTPSGKVEFTSSILARYHGKDGYDTLPVYHDWKETFSPDGVLPEEYPFTLVCGPRKPFLFHSRTYRVGWLSNLEKHTMITICGQDAEKLGLKEGSRANLRTPVGCMDYYVEIDEGILPGVVYIYHDDGDQNANLLVDDHYYDPISGFPGYRSYVCNIEEAVS